MTWKQCVFPLTESCERIHDGFELLAAAAGDAADVALFSRPTPDRAGHILLLSPHAVELAGAALSARWTACDLPQSWDWDLALGPPGALARLGLRKSALAPRAGRPPCAATAPTPCLAPEVGASSARRSRDNLWRWFGFQVDRDKQAVLRGRGDRLAR